MKLANYMKLLALTCVATAFLSFPSLTSFASSGGALDGMSLLMSSSGEDEGVTVGDNNIDEADEKNDEIDKTEDKSTTCGPEALIPVETCDVGQGLLCLNTPPFSVVENYALIRGTVDKRTNAFSHIRIYLQHEYTKQFREVEISSWAESDCWEDEWASSYSGCLDEQGLFGVKVPLSELGPYIIMIDAVSLNGEALSKSVRTSKVTPFAMTKEDVSLDPDPSASGGLINVAKVKLSVNLLEGCSNCDFIGATTGGIMITVTNLIASPDGGNKKIVRHGNISSAGRFDMCVPVVPGENSFVVEACNAATTGSCPRVGGIEFDVGSSGVKINIVSPAEDKLIYNASSYTVIPLKFSIDNYQHEDGVCREGDVVINWNRYKAVSLCPDADGYYNARLVPDVGANVGVIEVVSNNERISDSFVAGWGKVVNPYRDGDAGWVDSAVGLHIGSEYLNEKIRPVINNFLNSENLNLFLSDLLSSPSDESVAPANQEEDKSKADKLVEITKEIPYCSAGGSMDGLKIELVGDPLVERAEIERFAFKESAFNFKLNLEGVQAHIKIYEDKDGDSRPDKKTLPLMIAFKGAQIDGKFEIAKGKSGPLFLISSDNTDCSYQSSAYCTKKPAVLIPQNIVGGATRGGAFVRCDDGGQQISEEIEEACVGLNILNAQTAQLSQTILDTINNLVYCGVSSSVTYLMREGMKDIVTSLGCDESDDKESCEKLPSLFSEKKIWLSVGLVPANGKISIDKDGINADIPARFGSESVVANLDEAVVSEGAGVLTRPLGFGSTSMKKNSDDLALSINLELINQLLYQLNFQKVGSGLLDWNIDEIFFNDLGFSFVDECDAWVATPEVQKPSALCQMWPRVTEMLGVSLVTNNYFSGKHPIQLRLRGSRRIAPHIEIYKADVPYELPLEEGDEEIKIEYRPAQVLELQIPDLELSFYALEIDESAGMDIYGNSAVLLDDRGKPVIISMIKGSAVDVPIIRIRGSFLFALEIGELKTSSDDPSKLSISLRPVPQLVQMVFKKIKGGNATMVDDESVFSAFREKLKYAIEIYGDPDSPINLEISKSIALGFLGGMGGNNMFSRIGLDRLIMGNEGFRLQFDNENQRLDINLKPEIEQEF